jgi:hypothetical protein
MEPSEELKEVVARWFEAARAGDFNAVAHRFSQSSGFLEIGIDADEWLANPEQNIEVWRLQMEELGGAFSVWPDAIEAWREGSVGWAACRYRWETPKTSVDARATVVLHLEHGEWKIVQCHFSVGVPYKEFIGFELTTSIDLIAEAVQQERPDLSSASAPDGTVTIMFTDIEGSTAHTERMGDVAWMSLLRQHNRVVSDRSREHGGFLVKSQGDGYMLAFASARRALTCAAAIQGAIARSFADHEEGIRVRIGLHTGEAIREADDFFGKRSSWPRALPGRHGEARSWCQRWCASWWTARESSSSGKGRIWS